MLKRHGWTECGACGSEYWTGYGPKRYGPPMDGHGCWLCRRYLWKLAAERINWIGGRAE